MKDIIVKERTFSHPISKIWKAISEGPEISKWFIEADFKPETGYNYTFTASEEHGGTKIRGKVLKANPYVLAYTWRVGDTPVDTTVTWKLEELGEQTRLILEHSGISNYDQDTAIEMLGHFEKGWEACMNELENHLKDGARQPAH
jgi:uncharacterized protein YndB with AHSA1/START domain